MIRNKLDFKNINKCTQINNILRLKKEGIKVFVSIYVFWKATLMRS